MYDGVEALSTLAGLQLLPENQIHTLRLERAVQVACTTVNWRASSQALPTEELRTCLNADEFVRELAAYEDPPENFFTENFVFIGGNYVVFPGISTGGTFVLRHLLEGLFFRAGTTIPDEYLTIVQASVRAALTLSTRCARVMGHVPWLDTPDSAHSSIVVPDQGLDLLRQATHVTSAELKELLAPCGLDASDLDQLTVDIENVTSASPDQIGTHPIQKHPFLRLGDNLIVALPGSLLDALRHFVITTAQAFGYLPALMDAYLASVAEHASESLTRMRFYAEQIALPDPEAGLPLRESVWRIDSDKLCYMQVFVDTATDYDSTNVLGHWNTGDLSKRLAQRSNSVAGRLITSASECRYCLTLSVYAPIGREMVLGLPRDEQSRRTLLLDAESLRIVADQTTSDNLTLWKYAGAESALYERTKIVTWSFLDLFSLYWSHHQSFYLSDERPPDFLTVASGTGRSLRSKTLRRLETHATTLNEPNKLSVVVRRYDEEIPIWIPEGHLNRPPMELVEGLPQPIWVEANPRSGERQVLFELVEAVAYWVWQLTPGLSPCLVPLGAQPITFKVSAAPEYFGEALTGPPSPDPRLPRLDFEVHPDERTILVHLPTSLIPLLASSDNAGERVLIDGVLRALSALGASCGVDLELTNDERGRLLDAHAPLGQKKKFFVFDVRRNIRLSPRNLPRLRKLSDHDIEVQLEGLALDVSAALGPATLPSHGKIPKVKSKALFGAILERYLTRLRATVKQFDSVKLLRRLMSQNESVTREVEFIALTGPTSAACFGNIKSQAKEIAETLPALNLTAIAVRFLIEFVSAESPDGALEVSDADLDALLGLAYGYVSWGILGDEIRCRVVDTELSVLESGRIGTDRSLSDWIAPFFQAKSLESLEDEARGFEAKWRSPRSASGPPPVEDRVFQAEFGFSLTEMAHVAAAMVNIAFRDDTTVIIMDSSEAIRQIARDANLTDERVRAVVAQFSMGMRPNWRNAPGGYTDADILPWHFNRRLSHLRRPIVEIRMKEAEPLLAWGPRHLDRAMLNLLGIVMSGRFKHEHARSDEMREYIGRVVDERGEEFETTLWGMLSHSTNWRLEKNVAIRPGANLNASSDLGDVDVFAFDVPNKVAYACECKAVLFGRTPTEIAGEMNRLFKGDAKSNEPSRAAMHLKRAEWLAANWKHVVQFFGLETGTWKLVPVMVLNAEIPSTHLLEPPLPVVTFSVLSREGRSVLESFVATHSMACVV